jgi:hypothetical protein
MQTTDNTTTDNTITIASTELDGKPLFTYIVLTFTSTTTHEKTSIDLPFRRGIINVNIVKRMKRFDKKSFKRYMSTYYPTQLTNFDYCYNITDVRIYNPNIIVPAALFSPIVEIMKAVETRLCSVLIHYKTNRERINYIDSKHTFKTYNDVNYLSTINEVRVVVVDVLASVQN